MRADTFSTTEPNQLQRQLATWRRRQPGRAPLPEGLWRAAAQLARGQGASTVARTLHLDYYMLRERGGRDTAKLVGLARSFGRRPR